MKIELGCICSPPSFSHHDQTTFPNRQSDNRRTSMFLGGYCSELFVFDSCSKLQSGCKFDHSPAGLERCITSFTLLGKRELLQHKAPHLELRRWLRIRRMVISFPTRGFFSRFRFRTHFDVRQLLALWVFALAPKWIILINNYAELLWKHGIFRSREFEYHKIVGQAYSNTFMTVVCKALSHDHFH